MEARITSAELGETATFEVSRSLKPGEPAWSNYLRGVVAGCLEQGIDPGGFDALIISTVPSGGGPSSSAALEVATATLVEQLAGHSLPAKTKAMVCQKAEHEFANMPCGPMDQFVAVMAPSEDGQLQKKPRCPLLCKPTDASAGRARVFRWQSILLDAPMVNLA